MSIRITIEGTQEGLSRLQSLFESGEFDELSGFKVLEVRELTEQEERDRNNSRIFKLFHERIKELGDNGRHG